MEGKLKKKRSKKTIVYLKMEGIKLRKFNPSLDFFHNFEILIFLIDL